MSENKLDRFDLWMVKQHMDRIVAGQQDATDALATLRHNGYLRVAAELQRQLERSETSRL